ncbi:MAG: hypothetical protein UY67_C0032G0001 [Candidatus Kaiserbacteria bacterium GW2011_GWA2_52_12]|uniref:Uncharacterized protein n=1 Tax=Candidatus Kaiserbacteria bacterium GW2011_GWA2_52_12 TaxID=1618671 RepID=A0A0G1ZTP2_9BACT|nr:MAG: hypothetical protein UY67_C0032G0001 [Candidatus Kaiserbacteria bacterium GW2011_GWA2_52_12]
MKESPRSKVVSLEELAFSPEKLKVYEKAWTEWHKQVEEGAAEWYAAVQSQKDRMAK